MSDAPSTQPDTQPPNGPPVPLVIAAIVLTIMLPCVLGENSTERATWLQAVASALALGFLWWTLELQRKELWYQKQELAKTSKATRDNADSSASMAKLMESQLAAMERQLDLMKAAYVGPNLPVITLSHRFAGAELVVEWRNNGTGKARVKGLTIRSPGGTDSPLMDGLKSIRTEVGIELQRCEAGTSEGGILDNDQGGILLVITGRRKDGDMWNAFMRRLVGSVVTLHLTDLAGVQTAVASLTLPPRE